MNLYAGTRWYTVSFRVPGNAVPFIALSQTTVDDLMPFKPAHVIVL